MSAFPLDRVSASTRGFDVYDDRFVERRRGRRFGAGAAADRDGGAARRRLAAGSDAARRCSWVHLYEPHFPYAPPEPMRARSRRAVPGEVAAADAALAPLLGPCWRRGPRRTLVVLTGDHGESLGEHGEQTHGIFAYEATLRVPLILYARPASRPAWCAPVRHVDILPTVLDPLGVPPPADLRGVRCCRA